MKVTLVDVQQPEALFRLLNTLEGPVFCCGLDLRRNQTLENLICGMTVPGKGIPRLELTVSETGDVSRLLRYMREGAGAAA